MPEISDADLLAYQRAVQLIDGIGRHPEARADLQRAVKKLKPDYVTEEDQRAAILAPINNEVEALKKQIADRDAAEAKAKQDAADADALTRMESSFQRLRDTTGLQPAGEERVREIMKERNIFDPEAAFALFERQNPKPQTDHSAWSPPSWNFETEVMPDAKDWFVNTDQAEESAIGQVLLEMRKGRDE